MTRLEELQARQVLAAAGLDGSVPMEHASSVTNDVWITPDHVVRVSGDPDGRLAREAAIVADLPPEVGHPEVVHAGEVGQLTYVVTVRVPGVPLASVWSRLDDDERRRSVHRLGRMLRALHQTPAPKGLPLEHPPHPLGGERPLAPLLRAIDRVADVPGMDHLLVVEVRERVEASRDVLPTFDDRTLVHGDLTFANVLWHRGEVTALLDFEFARGAPADIDLDIVLHMCAFPELFVADDRLREARAADYDRVPAQLAEVHPALFDRARLRDRLRLFAIALAVRELSTLDRVRSEGPLEPGHPIRRLRSLLDGTSHVDRLAF